MTYDFNKPVNREGSECEKYDRRGEIFGREDVIPLWVADSDFEVAPFISEALKRRLSHPVFGYSYRTDSFFEVISSWIDRHSGWEIAREWVDFSPGVVAGIVFAMKAFSNEGDGVVIQPPVYPPFARMTKLNSRKLLNNPLVWNGEKYVIDFEDFEQKISQAKVFILCNPHNPTGRVFSFDELKRMGEICVKHNVYIISDDIHCDIIQRPYQHTPIASISDEIARLTVTLMAASKTFNVAGLSTSIAITPYDTTRRILRASMEKMHVDQGNIFGTVALEAAFAQGDEWAEQMNEYIGTNADFVVDFIKNNIPSVGCYKPEGTFLMWLDFRALGIEHNTLFRILVDKAGLGFNDGKHFGAEGVGFMRLNLATQLSVLEDAMNRLRDLLQLPDFAAI